MSFKDLVQAADSGIARLRTRAGAVIAGRSWDDRPSSVVETKGWVRTVMRERGKIVPGTHREGHNVWTNVGREYLALRMSKQEASPSSICYRFDMMGYIGVGTGSQIEDVNVQTLVTPVAYSSGIFLAPLDFPTFPLEPSRTVVRFRRLFLENEITVGALTKLPISEMGLFTDGNPATSNASSPRETALSAAFRQNPLAYKVIEPVMKTNSLEFEVNWEIRH